MLKENFKDEIISGDRTRQIVDAKTGAIIHDSVIFKNTFKVTQAGDVFGSKDVNEISKFLNKLGWGESIPRYTENCLLFDSNNANCLMYYNDKSTNKPKNSKSGFVIKLFISSSAYASLAFDLSNMKWYYAAYNPVTETWYGWFKLMDEHDIEAITKNTIDLIEKMGTDVLEKAHENTENVFESTLGILQTHFTNVAKLEIATITVNPAGNNYFGVQVPENGISSYIVPLYLTSSVKILDWDTTTTYTKINLSTPYTGNLTFVYLKIKKIV